MMESVVHKKSQTGSQLALSAFAPTTVQPVVQCCAPRMASRENHCDGNFVLSGIFSTKGCRIHLVLTKTSISWEIENVPKSETIIPLRHLIAVNPCDCSGLKKTKPVKCQHCRTKQYASTPESGILSNHANSLRLHFAIPYGRHMWRLDSQVFQALENTRISEWIDTIRELLLELNRPKRLLIFVNPYGGKKKGLKIYERKVSPVLYLAGVDTHVVVTQRANHAKEMIEDIDILKYDGIVCIGGDGMFSEILNGTLLKTQKEKGLDPNDLYTNLMVPRVPLGIIPAGSTNAAANCITGSCDPLSSTLLIIMGDCTGVDVCGVYTSGRLLRFAVTFLSYGYFGDVIRDSEKLRWMGPKRYDFSGFKKILCRKLYDGELQLQVDVPVNRSEWENELCSSDCGTCLTASHKPNCGTEQSSKKMKWLSVRGKFIAVNAAIMSCACYMTPKGISPSQHLGNGYCDVILVSTCSRFNYLRYLLRTSYHHRSPFDLNFVQVYRVREFRFNPFVTDDKTPATGCGGVQENWHELSTSVWNCDGEVVSEPSLSARVHCQLINVFGRGFESRKESSCLSSCFNFMKKG